MCRFENAWDEEQGLSLVGPLSPHYSEAPRLPWVTVSDMCSVADLAAVAAVGLPMHGLRAPLTII
jgi:hypothetical protein